MSAIDELRAARFRAYTAELTGMTMGILTYRDAGDAVQYEHAKAIITAQEQRLIQLEHERDEKMWDAFKEAAQSEMGQQVDKLSPEVGILRLKVEQQEQRIAGLLTVLKAITTYVEADLAEADCTASKLCNDAFAAIADAENAAALENSKE